MNRHTAPSTAITTIATVGLTVGLAISLFLAPTDARACDNEIRIAPETLNMRSSGTVVTVHTDVSYSDVDVYTVYLSGVAIDAWKADDRGYFVAKFLMDDIKSIDGLALNAFNTFTLVAMTIDGDPICGQAEVLIIDRGSQPVGADQSASNR
ncbi:MAG: hypothetical protein V2I67_08610 [Thermoanaerobaculales bacterium]|jgi:hypothetical protein|nr:hypothetical protein [Thermoanaerobaculales bacterium]